jgi:LysM repeat protein
MPLPLRIARTATCSPRREALPAFLPGLISAVTTVFLLIAAAGCGTRSDTPFMANDTTFVTEAGGRSSAQAQVSSSAPDDVPMPPPDDRTVAQRVADASTVARVTLALAGERSIAGYHLQITAYQGTITVAGRVAEAHRDSILQVISRTPGVTYVVDSLENPPEAGEDEKETAYHRVLRGETLGAIAARYQVTAGELRELNDLRGSAIRAGQRLRVR